MQTQELITVLWIISLCGHIFLCLAAYTWVLNDSIAYKVKFRNSRSYTINQSNNYAIWFFAATFLFSFVGLVAMLLFYYADKVHIMSSSSMSATRFEGENSERDQANIVKDNTSEITTSDLPPISDKWKCRCQFENEASEILCENCKRARNAIV